MKLSQFVETFIKKSDIYVPSTILFLIKNNGKGTKNQIAKLIYIFEYKKSVEEYEKIVENMSAYILKKYDIIEEKNGEYHLKEFPLEKREYEKILKKCMYSLNGFFVPVAKIDF